MLLVFSTSCHSQTSSKVEEFRIEHIGEEDHHINTLVLRLSNRGTDFNEIIVLLDKKTFQAIQKHLEASSTNFQKEPVQEYGVFNIVEKFNNGIENFYTVAPRKNAMSFFTELRRQADINKAKKFSEALDNLIYRIK
jgi:hypothetical protein